MKKTLKTWAAILIAAILLFSGIAAQAAYVVVYVDYWNSDVNNICKWSSTPTVGYFTYSTDSGFPFTNAMAQAKTQWTNAGMSSTYGSGSYDIYIVGGTTTALYNSTGISVSSGVNGVTYYGCTQQYSVNYNGSTKIGYVFNSGSVLTLIVDNTWSRTSTNNYANLRNTMLHEYGHALGWFGHSSVSSDVMYAYGNSITTLTTRDKQHLYQYYH